MQQQLACGSLCHRVGCLHKAHHCHAQYQAIPSAACIACSHHQAFIHLPQEGSGFPDPKLCLAPKQRKWLQVEMWLEARHTVPSVVEGVDICRGERVLMEVSRKFTVQDIRELAFKSGFFIQVRW